jgi:hypothetical protein
MKDQYNNVEELIKRLPECYEEECYNSRAIVRKREIKTPLELMKAIFLYVTGGYTLLEMSVILEEMGIGKLSDQQEHNAAYRKNSCVCYEQV